MFPPADLPGGRAGGVYSSEGSGLQLAGRMERVMRGLCVVKVPQIVFDFNFFFSQKNNNLF